MDLPPNHPMRRARQQLDPDASRAVLDRTTSGVLSLVGPDGWPYGVPLSHARLGDVLYLHCAHEGRKLEAMRACSRASFCAVERDDVWPERFTTCFRSAVAAGHVRVVEDEAERQRAFEALARKFSPGLDEEFRAEMASAPRALVVALDIEELTGKEAIELVREREAGGREERGVREGQA